MIRLSPSDAIFEGAIFFRDSEGHQITTLGTLDTYHNDLRFEFENFVVYYSLASDTIVYDTSELPKRITGFASERQTEGAKIVIHLSFIFEIGPPEKSRIYQAEGVVGIRL